MVRILEQYYHDYEANDNERDVYFMRALYVPFQQAQYIPVRCCDVMPDNYLVVKL